MEKSFFFHFYSELVFFYKSWFIWLLYKNFDFTNFACFLSNFVARLSSKLGRHIRSSIWVDLKWRTKGEVLIWMPNGKWHLGFERTSLVFSTERKVFLLLHSKGHQKLFSSKSTNSSSTSYNRLLLCGKNLRKELLSEK